MKKYFAIIGIMIFFSLILTNIKAAEEAFPGVKTEWNGYVMYKFEVDCGQFGKRPAQIVCPKEPLSGNPWKYVSASRFSVMNRKPKKQCWPRGIMSRIFPVLIFSVHRSRSNRETRFTIFWSKKKDSIRSLVFSE